MPGAPRGDRMSGNGSGSGSDDEGSRCNRSRGSNVVAMGDVLAKKYTDDASCDECSHANLHLAQQAADLAGQYEDQDVRSPVVADSVPVAVRLLLAAACVAKLRAPLHRSTRNVPVLLTERDDGRNRGRRVHQRRQGSREPAATQFRDHRRQLKWQHRQPPQRKGSMLLRYVQSEKVIIVRRKSSGVSWSMETVGAGRWMVLRCRELFREELQKAMKFQNLWTELRQHTRTSFNAALEASRIPEGLQLQQNMLSMDNMHDIVLQ